MKGGTAVMPIIQSSRRNPRYQRGGQYAADMAAYTRQMAADNTREQSVLRENLLYALEEDISPRQREMLLLYYNQGKNMREIAQELQVDRSTVSRTIKRGEQRLARCLRYGAASLLHRLEGKED